jgi:(p)ppGpp synthase/HD superfamily hydrolase
MSDTSAASLFSPAQTNTALYCQLHAAGHSTADLLRVQRAYRICCKLFNGRYRKTERAFICHAVGAGSSVAHFDRRIEMIIAGMLHAAFDSGQYPDGRIGLSDVHREWLAAQVGPEVEQIVARYNQFSFEMGTPESKAKAGVPKEQHDVLLIALAHEVDDMADGGLAFAPKYGQSIESRVAACAALARSIGQSLLAETLEGHGQRYKDIAWIAELQVNKLEGFRVAPNLRAYYRLRRDNRRGKSVEVF